MNGEPRRSRCGFVVAKFLAGTEALYLMRRSKKWHDINFVGGHEEQRDRDSLARTAHREMLEEVPQLRKRPGLNLFPLTTELEHGPVYSQSKRDLVAYELQFFLLRCEASPNSFLQSMTSRSPNILLSEQEMLGSKRYKISGLVELLDRSYPGGLHSLPLSWESNLGRDVADLYRAQRAQLQFDLDLPT
ncbi:NUDIX domain-containing protein [Terricaulis silvestris]|uniref:Uncharacterized protein n=1 Tax=Terricaulis silvestris TaxID=2686094 RepID=A0A6I6MPY2_9CAUL|nr:NUDIX domain-containing protein [Terricaulis silvestris]QGZ93203.1 hypothetical protein DSM104635_00009 [Terricaulis silvestris]